MRDFIFNILSAFGDFDFSLPQIATLLLLDEEQVEPTVKQIAEMLGRSLPTTSRILEQLVERGFISRREDAQDRRSKRVAITASGRAFIAALEQQRAEAQLAVMEYLPAEEQAGVARAMVLLAEAGKRRQAYEHSVSESNIPIANPQSE